MNILIKLYEEKIKMCQKVLNNSTLNQETGMQIETHIKLYEQQIEQLKIDSLPLSDEQKANRRICAEWTKDHILTLQRWTIDWSNEQDHTDPEGEYIRVEDVIEKLRTIL